MHTYVEVRGVTELRGKKETKILNNTRGRRGK
jgi:hypothetical protein